MERERELSLCWGQEPLTEQVLVSRYLSDVREPRGKAEG